VIVTLRLELHTTDQRENAVEKLQLRVEREMQLQFGAGAQVSFVRAVKEDNE
jgi:hypothetical protein